MMLDSIGVRDKETREEDYLILIRVSGSVVEPVRLRFRLPASSPDNKFFKHKFK